MKSRKLFLVSSTTTPERAIPQTPMEAELRE